MPPLSIWKRNPKGWFGVVMDSCKKTVYYMSDTVLDIEGIVINKTVMKWLCLFQSDYPYTTVICA